ncbi:MAG: hypothetical protein EA357_12235 [Micavibrio sp.]|nr:MAG: hypothetical protein EA357_12235 [Micavibrio sp.]
MVLVVAIYAAILAAFYLLLSLHVAFLRRELNVAFGDGGKEKLAKAIRTHGNFSEYVPFMLLLLVMLELNGTSDPVVHLLGGVFVLARCLHASGMLFSKKRISIRRVTGAALTWLLIGVSGALLLANVMHYVF